MTLLRPGELNPDSQLRADTRPTLYRDRRESEESIATELCDGPLLENHENDIPVYNKPGAGYNPHVDQDREALIERLKREQKAKLQTQINYGLPTAEPVDNHRSSYTVLDNSSRTNDCAERGCSLPNAEAGLEIQRPRSALHAGDFSTEALGGLHLSKQLQTSSIPISTSPPRPSRLPLQGQGVVARPSLYLAFSRSSRLATSPHESSAAPSSILSASPKYVLKPPTSPLVRESSGLDLDFEDSAVAERSARANRRHTLTPIGSFPHINDYSHFTAAARAPPSLRREGTYPMNAFGHKSRRSLGGSWTPQSWALPSAPPSIRSRAPSITSSDASPRELSMVGSYEESILRGRMSGTPSHPLTFEADIGALGKPGCKPMMPAHVHIDFPAVFYSWTGGHGRVGSVNQEPSPYVGRIDLENNLNPPACKRERKKTRSNGEKQYCQDLDSDTHRNEIKKRKYRDSESDQKPLSRDTDILLGGAYRIPRKGSLQLIIKNPNKTAVKVFIVPYDLEGMQPQQRTWVRQRLYSTGHIVENPISSRPCNGVDKSNKTNVFFHEEKPTLRYLIHFKICCTGKDRFYLYDEIRVVFANRVPDNKEKLRSEVMMPQDPKYMAFKSGPPTPTQAPVVTSPSSTDLSAAERAIRRRSHGMTPSTMTHPYFLSSLPKSIDGLEAGNFGPRTPPTPAPPMPLFYSNEDKDIEMTDADTEGSQSAYVLSPNREGWRRNLDLNFSSPEPAKNSASNDCSGTDSLLNRWKYDHVGLGSRENYNATFTKLTRDDARFGGYFGRSGTPEPGEGLLARRLKSLEADFDDRIEDEGKFEFSRT